jgi:hydroxymethylpyrimidine pyrophosphatase-like HAD family hydrolase
MKKTGRVAINSRKKFEEYDIEKVISYHGGLFYDNPNQRIKKLLLGVIFK